MKRSICSLIIVIICIFAVLPMNTYAATYNISETDMSVSIDDSSWYVFARDNLNNNPELDELGISYDAMYDAFHNNNVYMDALLFYDDGKRTELFIRKNAIDSGMVNLSNYSEKQILELAKSLAEKQGAEEYSIYENQYKFIKSEYIDSNIGYYICEFVTIVNKDGYTLTFQSESQFSDYDYQEIKNIVDSIKFDIDTTLKEKKDTSFWANVAGKTYDGAVIGAFVGAIIVLINKRKKDREKKKRITLENDTDTEQ